MSELEALLLGIVQGLTEFLPISSSGHLILVPWLQDYTFLLEHEHFNKTFDVALHVGTLVAAIGYFRHEVVRLIRSFFEAVRQRAIETPTQRLSVAIAVGTIPAALAGGIGASFFEDTLGEPWMVAVQLIVFGALLLWADRLPQRKSLEGSTIKDGFYIGVAQILALAPGTSRSGITITAGRWLGLDRDAAARFSFLLLIPVVTGAALYKGIEAAKEGLPHGVAGPMIVGTIAAAISGYLAIAFLLRLVRTTSYAPFVYYRYAVGALVLLVIATGLRPPTF
ncbi:MAG TPA: undecaprenyl-diphosphatase UppP [Solirubrobacterales bacterium]|jgi:undecaprenyl-diphosphatase|nr:undecaprenyl-diphosphatase UppP [Solirubrobacterales bacterium]